MKKDYVKPTMESEEFVANEYVAACWTATCLGCNAKEEAYDAMYNRIKNGSLTSSNDVYVYPGEIDGIPACSSSSETSDPAWATGWLKYVWWFLKIFFGAQGETTTTYYHPVNLTEGWTNHPNASV